MGEAEGHSRREEPIFSIETARSSCDVRFVEE